MECDFYGAGQGAVGPSVSAFEGEGLTLRRSGATGLSSNLEGAGPRTQILVRRQHHETQHGQEEEAGVQKEADRCRSATGRDNCNTRPYQSMYNAEGLGISKYKEHEGRIKAVFDFEKETIHGKGRMCC